MKHERINQVEVINHTSFRAERLIANNRCSYKLITNTNVGEYGVVCKYKESNDSYKTSDGKITKGSPIHYIQTIQIRISKPFKQVEVYQISTSSRNPHINSVIRIKNGKPFVLRNDTFEWYRFENMVEETKRILPKTLIDYINLALEIIDTGEKIIKTPKCIKSISKNLDKLQESKSVYGN